MLFETIGISMITGVMTGVLLSLMPISCVIYESILLKEKTSLLEKFFLLIGIVGVIYIIANSSGSDGENSALGIVFLLLAIVSGALYMVLATGMNNFALGRIKTSTMSAFGGISTLVTIAAGVFLNGEELYTYHYIGITLIIVRMLGVCYLASKNSQSAK